MYAIINNSAKIPARLAKGTNARLKLKGELVVKFPQDLADVDQEVKILQQLEEMGYESCPTLVDYSSSSITMSLINSAGTLQDYLELYAQDPEEYFSEMREIWQTAKEAIESFHELGFVHGDLHSRNILFEYEDGWVAYLIDFSSSYYQEDIQEFCEERALIPEELYTSEGDEEFLEEYILEYYPGDIQEIYSLLA